MRLRQMDALRGIAALFVVFNHYVQAVPEQTRLTAHIGDLGTLSAWLSPWTWLRFTPLRLMVDGAGAVDVFFVLSGFVLALTLTHDRQPPYMILLIKRACRIYIPFAVVISLTALAYSVIPTTPSVLASNWLNGLIPPMGYSLSAHLQMNGSDISLNPVMWTLVHEMRISVVLPVIFLLIRHVGAVHTVVVCIGISLMASIGLKDAISGSWLATLHFLWMFAAGSAAAYHRERLRVLLSAADHRVLACLWSASVALLIVPFDRVWSDFAIGGGAVLLIGLCVPTSRISGALTSAVPLWFGRISYSLYLIHLPILVLSITSGAETSASVYTFVVTLALAELVNRTIETPAHHIGITLTKMVGGAPRMAIVPTE